MQTITIPHRPIIMALSETRGSASGGALITLEGRNLGYSGTGVFGDQPARLLAIGTDKIHLKVPGRTNNARVLIRALSPVGVEELSGLEEVIYECK